MLTKAYILQEIKRTAKENGGKPLGQKKFVSETDIKISDWYGIHWARWGDALREAGFVPNKLTNAYDDSYLLDKLAQLAYELERLPTSADLRFKAHNSPEYPSISTFEKIGSKPEAVARLLDFCQDTTKYKNVVQMCREYVPRKDKSSATSAKPTINDGFVYLLKSGRFYKTGRTNDIGRREYELAIQLPKKVKKVHVIRTDDPVGIEAYWHKRFKNKRKNGEWFELNSKDVAAFKRRKFM
ncbi:MAG: GIY-YIG nuclease family protein [Pirellulaceae bacterium]|nr:GIY-YIG nuclease family protein [Pirellulaceae bacterium]